MAASNEYHLLSFIPATEAWEMPPILEVMAKELVKSGRMRISADEERNFVKYSTVDNDRAFSARELTDPRLLQQTREIIAQSVPMGLGESAIDDVLEQLQRDLKKGRGIDEEKEMRVARVLMQSAHAGVMMLALHEGAEFFVSYAHNVGELMALHFWDTHGTASGLQSACDMGAAIYVSCSGDPFFEGEQKTYTTDGWPALARMVVIAGQEIGHYADLIRSPHGIVGRVSANMASFAPSMECKSARDMDMALLAQYNDTLMKAGMGALYRAERAVEFYDERVKLSLRWAISQLVRAIVWTGFMTRVLHLVPQLHTYPALRCATGLTQFIQDMAFNLAPDADAYRRADPIEEEAIACIEALARVPQQVNKWGHAAVALAIPNMYRLYYGAVIPNVTAALGADALAMVRAANNMHIKQKLKITLRRLTRARPGWHPEKPSKS